MEINYIILAHQLPEQIYRLVYRLNSPWVKFYIHIDKKIEIAPFRSILRDIKNLYFLEGEERYLGTWGDIGIVRGTLAAMERIIKDNRKGYCILLTGQDYPLKNNRDIQNHFIKSNNSNFITIFPLPHRSLFQGGMPRVTKYKINKSIRRGHFLLLPSIFEKEFYDIKTFGKLNYLRKSGKSDLIFKIFRKRGFPENLSPHSGGVYWALPVCTIMSILAYLENNPEYLDYHEFTLCADEIFFHSIIAKLEKEKGLKIKRSLTYVNWERKTGPLPVTFEFSDSDELRKASKDHLFARKFDITLDEKILNFIDKELLD